MTYERSSRKPARMGVLLIAALLGGCSTTTVNAPPTTAMIRSGFLSDYSVLSADTRNRGRLRYEAPNRRIAESEGIAFDRIHIWRTRDDSLGNIEALELQRVADDLYFALRAQLENDYAIVEEPNGAALVIHLGLTDVRESDVPLDVFATSIPPVKLLSEDREPTDAVRRLLGAAAIEMEIEDAKTGEVLFAAIDRRISTDFGATGPASWATMREAFEFWANRVAARLTASTKGKR